MPPTSVFVPGSSGTYRAPRWRDGYYYGPHGGAATTVSLVANYVYYVPTFMPAQAIDRLGIEVTTAAASATLNLGIYEMTATGVPGSRLLQLGATLDASTTGGKEGTVSYTGPGDWVFFAAISSSGSVVLRGLTVPGFGAGRESLTAPPRGSFYESSSGSTLPTTANAASGAGNLPAILVRAV